MISFSLSITPTNPVSKALEAMTQSNSDTVASRRSKYLPQDKSAFPRVYDSQEEKEITNFIYSTDSSSEAQGFDFLYCIENNSFFNNVNNNLVNDVISYKSSIIDKKFDQIENKFNMFSNIRKNDRFLYDYFTNKLENNLLIYEKIQSGVEEKTESIKLNSFENKLKSVIVDQEATSEYFFQITNFFNQNKSQENNQNEIKHDKELLSIEKKNSSDSSEQINASFLEESLIKIYRPSDSEYLKSIKTTSNDIVIQNFINFSRSFYTISSRSFLQNYKSENFHFINFENTNNINAQTEIAGLRVFDYINESSHKSNLVDYFLRNINEFSFPLENYKSQFINNIESNFVTFKLNTSNWGSLSRPDFFLNWDHDPTGIYTKNDLEFRNIFYFAYDVGDQNKFLDNGLRLNAYYSNKTKVNRFINRRLKAIKTLSNFVSGKANSLSNYSNNDFIESYQSEGGLIDFSFTNLDLEFLVDFVNSPIPLSEQLDNRTKDSILAGPSLKHAINILRKNFNASKDPEFYKIIYFREKPIFSFNENNNETAVPGTIISVDSNNRSGQRRYYSGFKINKEADTDRFVKIVENEILYKTEIDEFIKKIKLKRIKNLNIDVDFVNEVIANIKNKNRNSLSSNENSLNNLISYCFENTENISVIDKEDKLFDFLFSIQEDLEETDVYSHTDIVSDHTINNVNFLGLDSLKANDISVNNNRELFANNFKNLLSNYYPKNEIFSSSTFFNNILKNIFNETQKTEDVDKYFDKCAIQSLYFNYFYNNKFSQENNVKSTKNTIAKRFFKKAIAIDTVSDYSLTDIKFSDYVYKSNDIKEEDYDLSSEGGSLSFLDDILNSSENLNIIRKNIFSKENIESLSDFCNYKNFNNFSLNYKKSLAGISQVIKQEILELDFYLYCVPFPFKFYKNNFKYITNEKYAHGEFLNTKPFMYYQYKNRVSEENEIKKNDFDITETKNIKVNIYSLPKSISTSNKTKNQIINIVNSEFSNLENIPEDQKFFTIEDFFDECCNEKNLVFNKICKNISSILRVLDPEYSSQSFDSEELIDAYVENNSFILDYIIKVIDFYSNLYLTYLGRIQRSYAIKAFRKSSQKSVISNGVFNIENISSYSCYDKEIHENSYSDIKKIIDSFESNNFLNLDSSIKNPDLNYNADKLDIFAHDQWNSSITQTVNNIMNSLKDSDFKQAFYFDFINAYIINQEENINSSREDLSSSSSFEELQSYLPVERVNYIENNFYNEMFINKLSKNLYKDYYINEKYSKYIQDNTNNNNLSIFKQGAAFFNILKDYEKSCLKGNNFSFDDNVLSNEVFGEKREDFLSSSFYSFGIKNSTVSSLGLGSFIKFTVYIVDQFNLNHFYLPKTFIFSPFLTDVDFISPDSISGLANNFLGYYNPNENISKRLYVSNVSELIKPDNEVFVSFKNSLRIKLSKGQKLFSLDRDMVNITKYLFYCHLASGKSKNIKKTLYNIDQYSENSGVIDKQVVNRINQLSEKEFFNIFDHKKSKVQTKIAEDINNFIFPSAYESIKDNTNYYMLASHINKIGSIQNLKETYDDLYYDTYCIPVNPKNFKYIDINNNEYEQSTSFNFDGDNRELLSIYALSDTSIDFITDTNNFINDNNFVEDQNFKVNNFNVYFNIEILR